MYKCSNLSLTLLFAQNRALHDSSLRATALGLLAGLLAFVAPGCAAAEICRFSGPTNHDGHIAVTTEVTQSDDIVTVNAMLTLTASAWIYNVEYLVQEISTWRGTQLQSLAVNGRTVIDGTIKRQQWDVWVRGPGGLAARRVQAKTLADFQQRHPGFVRHWAVAAFGQPWLQDYAAAVPERRPDLDVPVAALAPGLSSPLALAFYWSRFLPPGGGAAPVFLPGFKHDATADLAYGPATLGEGWRRWVAPLHHPGLSGSDSYVAAWVSPNRYLLQLAVEARAPLGSGRALIRTEGCQGVQIAPARGQSGS